MTLQFLGYALPGTVMFLFGVGWCWGHAAAATAAAATPLGHRYARSKGKGSRLARLDRGLASGLARHPVQGVLKLLVSLVGIVGSLFAAYPDGSFQYVGDVPFATVYLFFALSGVVDVLGCYCPRAVTLAHARLVLALAFFMEAFLFHSVEVELGAQPAPAGGGHSLRLLVAVMVTCGAATALAGDAADAVRCVACVLHGTWLYHCGLLLYWPPPALTPDREHRVVAMAVATAPTRTPPSQEASAALWVTLCFAWHCAAAVSLLVVFLAARRSSCSASRRPHSLPAPYPFGSPAPRDPRAVLSPASHPHSCVLCDASTSISYHRTGSLV